MLGESSSGGLDCCNLNPLISHWRGATRHGVLSDGTRLKLFGITYTASLPNQTETNKPKQNLMEPIKLDSTLWETQAIKESVEAAGCTEAVGTHGTQCRVLDRSWKEKEEMTGENSWDLKRLKRCKEHM